MLYDSLVFIGRDTFPLEPEVGQVVYLKKPYGNYNKGLYYWTGEEWSDGVDKRGIDAKDSVKVASNGASYVRYGQQVIDKVTVEIGDRVLLKDQDDPRTNGIYVVQEEQWTRPTDANSDRNITPGMFTYVEDGEHNSNSSWILRAPEDGSNMVLGTTFMYFAIFSGEGMINVGTGLVRTGDAIALAEVQGLTAGTYGRVTVDRFGRIIGGNNPSTLAGHGITDGQSVITGAISEFTVNNMIPGRMIISDVQGKLRESDITTERLNEINSAITNFDTALAAKQDAITGAASTVTSANLTGNKVVVSTELGKITASEASAEDLDKINGLTGNAQTQLDSKLDKSGGTLTGSVKYAESPSDPSDLVNRKYVDEQVSMVAPMPRSIFSSVPGQIVTFSGGVRWYPPFPVVFTNVRCFVNTTSEVQPIVIDVVLNNTTSLFGENPKPTIPIQSNDSGNNVIDVKLDTSDFITLSVLSGGGSDLSVRIDYIADRDQIEGV